MKPSQGKNHSAVERVSFMHIRIQSIHLMWITDHLVCGCEILRLRGVEVSEHEKTGDDFENENSTVRAFQ